MNTPELPVIAPNLLYPLSTFERVTGLKKAARSRCRREGLIIRKVGNKHFVSGADFIRYVQERGRIVQSDGTSDGGSN